MPYMTIDIRCIPGNIKKRKFCTIRWSSQHDHINKYRTYSQCKSLTRRSCPTPLLCVKCVTDIAIFLCLSLVITGDALSLDWVSATVYESRNTELVFAGPGRMLVEAALSSPSVLETIGQKESCVLHTSLLSTTPKSRKEIHISRLNAHDGKHNQPTAVVDIGDLSLSAWYITLLNPIALGYYHQHPARTAACQHHSRRVLTIYNHISGIYTANNNRISLRSHRTDQPRVSVPLDYNIHPRIMIKSSVTSIRKISWIFKQAVTP